MESTVGEGNALQSAGAEESSIHDRSSFQNEPILGSLKQSVNKLVNNQIDEFEVLFLAQQVSLDLQEENSFSQRKYAVLQAILQQIVKVDGSDYYLRLLEETSQNLKRKKPIKYLCCLAGCLFQANRHREYLQHLKRVHSTHSELYCNFMHKCMRQFSNMDLLVAHVKACHSNVPAPRPMTIPETETEVDCRCDMVSCRGINFPNINQLMTHFVNYHNQETRQCLFDGCDVHFKPGKPSTVRHHFSNKHKKLNKLKLKSKNIVNPIGDLSEDPFELPGGGDGAVGDDDVRDGDPVVCDDDAGNREDGEDFYTEEDFVIINDSHGNVDREDSDHLIMQYADFLNRLSHFKHVPYTTVQEISTEYFENYVKAKETREKKLRLSLKKIPSMTEEMINQVLSEVTDEDEFLRAQQNLDTEYKRTKFVQEHFKYIAPVEIVLNKEEVLRGESKEVFHYIPVTHSFQHLLEDTTFNEMIDLERESSKQPTDSLKDITDGAAFKENEYFRNNPGAFAGHLYSDSVELSNPLGAARGKHKINQVFYTVAQIPKGQRSQIDRIQLCMVFKEKLVKKYGYRVIFQTLISDLKKLEEGIMISYPIERKVQMGLLVYSADNLEAHSIGGFSQCFSSKDICRFCHATHKDLESHIHDYDHDVAHKYWSIAEYDSICDSLEEEEEDGEVPDIECLVSTENLFSAGDSDEHLSEGEEDAIDEEDINDEESEDVNDEDTSNNFGLKMRCPFNQLKAFHCILNMPPDYMHDGLEGVVAQDLFGVIKILVKKGIFTLEEYNSQLKSLDLHSHEAADKPQLVPLKGKKLPGKALSLLVHVRNFPLIIKHLVDDPEDDIMKFALMLVDITNRLTAAEIRNYEISVLEDKIVEYLDARKDIFAEFPLLLGTAKPKEAIIKQLEWKLYLLKLNG